MHFSLSFRFPWSFHPITLDFRWDQPSWHGEHKGSKCSYYGVEETHRAITRSKARSYPSTAHPSKPLQLSRPTFHSSNICKYAKNIWVHPRITPCIWWHVWETVCDVLPNLKYHCVLQYHPDLQKCKVTQRSQELGPSWQSRSQADSLRFQKEFEWALTIFAQSSNLSSVLENVNKNGLERCLGA